MKNAIFFTPVNGININPFGFSIGLPAELISQDKNIYDIKKPNIVLIILDEYDGKIMHCMGDSYVHTPNLDDLTESGILFRFHYCASFISNPSRQSLTTRKHESHHKELVSRWGDPEHIERRYRSGTIPEAPQGVIETN